MRASGLVFLFCAPGHIFGGTEGAGSRFHVLRATTHFRRCRVRWVPFSFFSRSFSISAAPRTWGPFLFFALPDSFSAIPRASVLVFMFCAHKLIFGGNEGVGSHFHDLRARTHFRRYLGRRVPFLCFARPFIFSCTEGVVSRFHYLRAHTRVRRYRGRRVPFSCSARLDTFSAVPRAAVPFSCFALSDSFSAVSRASVPFLCFARPDLFPAVPKVSGPHFMFCALRLNFGGVVCVGSLCHVLRACSCFKGYRGVESRIHVLRAGTRF
jgi:hypothetical protein